VADRSIRVNVEILDALGVLAGDLLVENARGRLRGQETADLFERFSHLSDRFLRLGEEFMRFRDASFAEEEADLERRKNEFIEAYGALSHRERAERWQRELEQWVGYDAFTDRFVEQMARRYFTAEDHYLYTAAHGKLELQAKFYGDDLGEGAFREFLRGRERALFALLADLAGEDFHEDQIPVLRGADREGVVQRRLAQRYRDTRLAAALSLGKVHTGQRRNERLGLVVGQSLGFEQRLDDAQARPGRLDVDAELGRRLGQRRLDKPLHRQLVERQNLVGPFLG
jgi:hypothetical protein